MFNLFLIFERKVLPFLKNINDEVSSDNKDEVANMMAAVPKLSYAVSHYSSRRLRVNVQFLAIEKLYNQLKQTHPSFIWFQPSNKTFYR